MRIATLLSIAVAASSPAFAQTEGAYGPVVSPPPAERVDPLLEKARDDIRQGRRDGRLSRREAKALRRDVNRVEDAQDRFAQDGLSASEHAELRNRADALRSLTTAATPPGKFR